MEKRLEKHMDSGKKSFKDENVLHLWHKYEELDLSEKNQGKCFVFFDYKNCSFYFGAVRNNEMILSHNESADLLKNCIYCSYGDLLDYTNLKDILDSK